MSFTSEVELNHLEVRDPDGRLGDSLLVVVVPLAAQPLGLVPDLDEVLVILNHDVVLVKLAVHVGLGPALQVDVCYYLLSNILVTVLIICIHPKIFLDCTQKS